MKKLKKLILECHAQHWAIEFSWHPIRLYTIELQKIAKDPLYHPAKVGYSIMGYTTGKKCIKVALKKLRNHNTLEEDSFKLL